MLTNIVAGAVIVGFLLLWVRFFTMPADRRMSWLQPRKRIQSPIGLVDAGMMYFLVALGIITVGLFLVNAETTASIESGPNIESDAGETLGAEANLPTPASPVATVIVGLARLVMTILAIVILSLRYRNGAMIVGWQPKALRRDLVLGGMIFFMIVPLILAVQTLLTQYVKYEHQTLNLLSEEPNLSGIFAGWFTAVLVAPICEEVFFRSVLQGWLQRIDPKSWFTPDDSTSAADQFAVIGGGYHKIEGRPAVKTAETRQASRVGSLQTGQTVNPYGTSTIDDHYQPKLVTRDSVSTWMPILLSALLFAAMHIGQGPAPIPLFLLGIALGFVYYRTHSLVACITIHMLLNGFSMLIITYQTLTGSGL